jgi:hypothetical protein
MGTFERTNLYIHVLEAVHIAIQIVIMETNMALNVSKSVALYQKHLHIKACLARRYIPRACGQDKMTFITANGKVNYAEAKGYCLITLLSFMQKTMQKLVT